MVYNEENPGGKAPSREAAYLPLGEGGLKFGSPEPNFKTDEGVA